MVNECINIPIVFCHRRRNPSTDHRRQPSTARKAIEGQLSTSPAVQLLAKAPKRHFPPVKARLARCGLGGLPWELYIGGKKRAKTRQRNCVDPQKRSPLRPLRRSFAPPKCSEELRINPGSQRLSKEWSLGDPKRNMLYFSGAKYSLWTSRVNGQPDWSGLHPKLPPLMEDRSSIRKDSIHRKTN